MVPGKIHLLELSAVSLSWKRIYLQNSSEHGAYWDQLTSLIHKYPMATKQERNTIRSLNKFQIQNEDVQPKMHHYELIQRGICIFKYSCACRRLRHVRNTQNLVLFIKVVYVSTYIQFVPSWYVIQKQVMDLSLVIIQGLKLLSSSQLSINNFRNKNSHSTLVPPVTGQHPELIVTNFNKIFTTNNYLEIISLLYNYQNTHCVPERMWKFFRHTSSTTMNHTLQSALSLP